MSKITAEFLRAMVGVKAGQRPLIDKLVEPLNLCLPAYGIANEFRICGFLATAAPESDWFKTLREYGKGAGRAYGKADKVTGLVYYGRGIFQDTWKKGYQAITDYVAENWDAIKERAAKYGFTEPPDFVADPELLATPYWAVEAACIYWKLNGLAAYADRGLKGFFGLEGKVNRGRDDREALGYADRLRSYETARRLLPDDFALNNSADVPAADTRESVTENAVIDPADGIPDSAANPPTSLSTSTGEQSQPVVVEKEENVGFFTRIKLRLTGWLTALGGLTGLQQAKESIDSLNLPIPTWLIAYLLIGAVALFLGWLLFEAIQHFIVEPLNKRSLTTTLIAANATPTNTVVPACRADLERYAAAGYKVIPRQ